jgi:hypothetical protein
MTNELKERADFYLNNKTKVHIELHSKRFYNGLIIEVGDNSIILHDRFIGEIPISFSEINVMEKYKGGEE